jgi:Sulfate permease family
VFSLLARVARLGFITDFLSKPIPVGCILGATLTVIGSQLGKMFGIKLESVKFFRQVLELIFDSTAAEALVSLDADLERLGVDLWMGREWAAARSLDRDGPDETHWHRAHLSIRRCAPRWRRIMRNSVRRTLKHCLRQASIPQASDGRFRNAVASDCSRRFVNPHPQCIIVAEPGAA